MKLLSWLNNEVTEHQDDLSNGNNANAHSSVYKHAALFQVFGIDISPLNPKKKRRRLYYKVPYENGLVNIFTYDDIESIS